MRSVFVIPLLACTLLYLVFLLFCNYRLHERFFRFFEAPIQGKVWQTETEKFFKLYPAPVKHSILFAGDSHMEQCEWHELFPGKIVLNRGIGSEQSRHLLERLRNQITDSMVIVIQTGINDLISGIPVDSVLASHRRLFQLTKEKKCTLYPCMIFYTRFLPEVNSKVFELNGKLSDFYSENEIPVVDINPMISENHRLLSIYTLDGLHLNAKGYGVWHEALIRRMKISRDSR